MKEDLLIKIRDLEYELKIAQKERDLITREKDEIKQMFKEYVTLTTFQPYKEKVDKITTKYEKVIWTVFMAFIGGLITIVFSGKIPL